MSASHNKKDGGIASAQSLKDLASIVNQISGIQLGDRQKLMIEMRIQRRMTQLGLKSETEYLSHFNQNRDSETQALISLLTTHHTFFFREASQFEFLELQGLKKIVKAARDRGERKIRVWSAACSRGQEVWTLAMVLQRWLKLNARDIDFEILGTDIDEESIQFATNGVYTWREIREIPLDYLEGNWARGTGEISEFVKAKETLRSKVRFERLNLLELASQKPGAPQFDIIFCRNVFIYFTAAQIQTISEQIIQRLSPQGYFFVGLSESLMNQKLPLEKAGGSIYQPARPSAVQNGINRLKETMSPKNTEIGPQKLRALLVDDSPTVLRLLNEVLGNDPGFEIVGTASNGIEATEQVKKLKPDVVTLDIHMPEMDGIEYLGRNMNPSHPAVVVISSVPREDSELALRALQLGARDYVEKPGVSDLATRGEEIRTKLRSAWRSARAGRNYRLDVDESFKKVRGERHLDGKLRILVGSPADRERMKAWIREASRESPPCSILLCEGADTIIDALAAEYSLGSNQVVKAIHNGSEIPPTGTFSIGDFGKCFKNLTRNPAWNRISVLVFGEISRNVLDGLRSTSRPHIVLEDVNAPLKSGYDIQPITSFHYLSEKHLFGDSEPTSTKIPSNVELPQKKRVAGG
jgi:chemotaxis protein methyltransferase CheR